MSGTSARRVRRSGCANSNALTSRDSRECGYLCEPLERRLLLTTVQEVIPLGTLVGRQYLSDQFLSKDTPSKHEKIYVFTLTSPAVVDVQLSRLNGFFGEDCDIFLNDVSQNLDQSTRSGSGDEFVSKKLPAGDFSVTVKNRNRGSDAHYTLAIVADLAPFSFDDGKILDGSGREFGTLLDGASKTGTDFIGQFDGSDRLGSDQFDENLFTLPAAGQLGLTIDGFQNDPNGGQVRVRALLSRDDDGDGGFAEDEFISADSVDSADDTMNLGGSAPAGRYDVSVESFPFGGVFQPVGGSNYKIHLSFTAKDSAGNSTAAARDIGVLGATTQTFSDYLSPLDTVDIYRFTTGTGGPFVLQPLLSGASAVPDVPANFVMDVVRASDNGVLAHDLPADQEAAVPLGNTRSFFVKVRRVSGEGTYTVSMSTRNLDLAGNSFATAKNLEGLFGRRRLSDSLSSSDRDDFYRFTLDAQARVSASFPATAAGTNASLLLFRKEAGNVLRATSNNAGNAAESLSDSLPSGTYFLQVHRIAGSPAYNLSLIADAAGGSFGTARTLSETAGSSDFIGPGDKDVFRVDLSANRRLGAQLVQLHDSFGFAAGNDSNGNSVLDDSEKAINTTISDSGLFGSVVAANLLQGTVIIEITPTANTRGTNYSLNLETAPLDNAGNLMTAAAARSLSVIGTTQTVTDFVGDGTADFMDDNVDFYHFTVGNNGPFTIAAQLLNLQSTLNADLQLIRDDNGNGLIDRTGGEDEVRAESHSGGLGAGESLTATVLDPGDYFVRVRRVTGTGQYTVSVRADSLDTAANTLGTAFNLGALDTRVPPVIARTDDFVGDIDRDDFFRFSVSNPGEASLHFPGAAQPDGITVEVIHDADNDHAVDNGEVIVTTSASRLATAMQGIFLPAADDRYYLHIKSDGTNTIYNVVLDFTRQTPHLGAPFLIDSANTAGTTIQCEDYDDGLPQTNGGEGISYHDSTPENVDGIFRTNESVEIKTTNDAGGGFRIATTAVGEFLEYSIFVTNEALYDFQFRVASNLPGVSFVATIDDVRVTTPLTIPDTPGTFDGMRTVTETGIPLLAGPHILRLELNATTGQNNGFAGSYNFIKIVPTPGQTGTFKLTPAQATVAAAGDQRVRLSLEWTVPFLGWRTLKDVQLRLRDEQGIAFWVLFDEGSNTMKLVDPDNNSFGPARAPGSNAVLEQSGVALHLARTRVSADGPADPSVVLSFDLVLKQSVRGRHFLVEVAASDDLGHAEDFAQAGTLDVAP